MRNDKAKKFFYQFFKNIKITCCFSRLREYLNCTNHDHDVNKIIHLCNKSKYIDYVFTLIENDLNDDDVFFTLIKIIYDNFSSKTGKLLKSSKCYYGVRPEII